MQPLRTGAVAAECKDGMLSVWPAPGLGLKPLPGGSMHYHDVGLFRADVSANATLRAKAWLKQTRASKDVQNDCILLAGLGGSMASSGLDAIAPRPVAERQFALKGPDVRKIRVSEWKPRGKAKAVVMFSHGAGSSPRFY